MIGEPAVSVSLFETGADEVLDGGIGAKGGLGGADGIVGFDLFEAEGHEGEDGVVDFLVGGRKAASGAEGLPCAGGADLVLEFDDDAFGGFFTDAGDLGEGFDVAIGDSAAQGGDVHAAEDVEGDFGADTADGVNEQAEHVALGGSHETVEDMGILANGEVSEEVDIAAGRGEFIVRGKGDEDIVADAVDLNDGVSGEGFDEFAVEKEIMAEIQNSKLKMRSWGNIVRHG